MHASPFSRESETTLETVTTRVRHQLDADCELGLFPAHADDELDRIAARSVESLWGTSRIKTFLPIFALRHARDEIRASTTTR